MDAEPFPPTPRREPPGPPRRPASAVLGAVAVVAGLAGGGAALGLQQLSDTERTRTVTSMAEAAGLLTTPTRTVHSVAPSLRSAGARGNGKTINEIYREDGPGVVTVVSRQAQSSSGATPDFGFGNPQPQSRSQGSGFVLDRQGYILTNEHVVDRATEVTVSFSNRDGVPAKVVGTDISTDLALLRVDLPANALHPLPLGQSSDVEVGDAVVAIGNPFGYERTVTAGIVSAVQRRIQAPNGFTITNAIQTDAPINHGNSGGPLIDADGAVIGINAQIAAGSGVDGNVGIGFAIPVDTAKRVIEDLRARGKVEHAWLGIQGGTIDSTLARTARVPADEGVLIDGIVPSGPAASAGLRSSTTSAVINGDSYCLGGDVITAADGEALDGGIEELQAIIQRKRPGDRLRLTVARKRDEPRKTITVTLGRQPRNPPDATSACSGG